MRWRAVEIWRAAQTLADKLEIKANSGEWIPASAMTEAYIGLGKKDRAFFWFNRCVAEHSCSLLEANAEPIYSGLSGDRRFEKIAGPLYGHENELAADRCSQVRPRPCAQGKGEPSDRPRNPVHARRVGQRTSGLLVR